MASLGWIAALVVPPAALPLRALGAGLQLAAALLFALLIADLLIPRRTAG
jgi:hypothetical protein